MKKPTILKIGLLSLIFLQSIISHSQNLVSYVEKSDQRVKAGQVLADVFPLNTQANVFANDFTPANKDAAVAMTNPIIPYAQLPYAGQVSICPNDGNQLPKLFLCGGNDSRPLQVNIPDAQSITWEKFISGGSCATVANSDCANLTAAAACWVQVETGKDFLANSAGQFRVKITDKTGTPFVFYFNVYQNTLIPTATSKSDIIKNAAGCQIDGQIKVDGFGNGYEYSFSRTGSPGAWQDSNIFTTSTAGNYTAFIRIKNVVGSCEFKVINLEIKNLTFTTTSEIAAGKCDGDKGSIRVITNDINKKYTYKIFNPAAATNTTALNTFGPTENAEYTFTGLNAGTYRIETSVEGSTCMTDTQKTVVVPNTPAKLTSTVTETKTLTNCASGTLTVTQTGGTYPFRYLVDVNGAGFVQNGTNVITVVTPGKYLIRVEDTNGCFVDKEVTVANVTKPIYTITKTDGSCTDPRGTITVNVSNTNSFIVEYSLDVKNNGAFETGTVSGTTGSKVYSNLDPGNYIITVRYKKSGVNGGNYCTDPIAPTSIGLTTALTASAGVAELSGCGPAGKTLQGKVRITNAEGGVPIAGADPYLYSFDGKKSWTTKNEAYVDPGVHTFYVKDSKCEVALPAVTLATKPADPTIKVDDPVFNCDGSATTVVTVTNGSTTQFSYDYYMDGKLNTNNPNNIFTNVTQGDHTVTVSYNVLKVPTESVLLNESFGSGPDVSSPGINPNFCWERQVEATKCNNNKLFGNGEYTVTNLLRNDPYSGWWSPRDNTTKGVDTNGRFLAVDAGTSIPNNAVLYRKTIKDIIPNQPIKVTFVATNLLKVGNTQPDASLTVELQNASRVPLSSQSTGGIPKTNGWVAYSKEIDPGNNTTLDFVLRLELSQVNGIDFAVDDLVVTQMPKACNTVASFPIVVDGSKAFSAGITGFKNIKCSGEKNGEITLSAKNFNPKKGFQYSVDGGGWQTVIPVPEASSGSKTLTNLEGKIYNISIRYDDSAGSCTFPLRQEIKSPSALEVSATVTTKMTCDHNATITAEAKNGTPGYQYKLTKESDGSIVVDFQDSGIFENVDFGKYVVIARDFNSCPLQVPAKVEVVKPEKPKGDFLTSSLCFDPATGTDLTIVVTGGLKPYTYVATYNGVAGQESAKFDGPNFTYNAANAGTYSFVIRDANGCYSEPITKVIAEKLITLTPAVTPLDCEAAPANQAVISVTINGGTAPYVVSLLSGTATGTLTQPVGNGNTFSYSIAASGAYKFQVKDVNGCITTSDATINPLVGVTGKVVKATDPKCNNGSNGQVEIEGGGGTGTYTYSFNGSGFTNKTVYTNLDAKTTTSNTTVYKYQIKDSNGCLSPIYDVTLNNPAAVVASASFPPNTTCAGSVTITVAGAGGSGGFKYSFNGSPTYTGTNTLSVTLTASTQDITYSVEDSNGCRDTKQITVPAYNPPTEVKFSTPPAITCKVGGTTTSVTVSSVGGVAPFTYTLVSGPSTAPSNSTGLFTGLVSGQYTFEVKDSNGCTKQGILTVDPKVAIKAGEASTNVKCIGSSDGTATFTVSNVSSTGNFDYTITPTQPATSISKSGNVVTVINLAVGSYTFVATDKTTGCVSNSAVAVVDPATAINFTVASTKIHCNEKISTITFPTLSGGTPGYTYAFVTSGPTAPAATAYSTLTTVDTSVLGTTIDVYVKDNNGCVAPKKTITIASETPPQINTPAAQCYTGSLVSVKITGTVLGTPTYSIDDVTYGGNDTFLLGVGTHTLYIKDGFGCKAQTTYKVAEQLTLGTDIVPDTSCTPNTTIKLTANGGTVPYVKYEVSTSGAGGPFTTITDTYTATAAGTYTFRVTDSATPACTAVSAPVTVTLKATALTINATPTHVKCNGDATGVITITALSGKAPFKYNVTKAGVSVSTSATTTGLKAGLYNVVVTDDLGCTSASTPVTINELSAVVASASFPPNTTCAGSVTITVAGAGGSGGFKYSFNGSPTYTGTNTLPVTLTASTQNITYSVEDSNGCRDTKQITVPAYNPPSEVKFSTPPAITCKVGGTTTSVTVSSVGGVAPFTYTLVSGPSTAPSNSTGLFTGLVSGQYTFEVKDSNGCTKQGILTVDPKVAIKAGESSTNVKCIGSSDGTATFTVSDVSSIGNFTYKITPAQPLASITESGNVVKVINLAVGSYTFVATDKTTGCVSNSAVAVVDPATAINFTVASTKIHCNEKISTITFPTLSGGTPGYTYAFVTTGPTAPLASAYSTLTTVDTSVLGTTIDVYVKDNNGCVAPKKTITIASETPPQINTPAAQCYTGSLVSVKITGTVLGTPTYSIDDVTYGGNDTFLLGVGTHTLYIKDGFGCKAQTTYKVAEQLTLGTDIVPDTSCTPNTTIKLTANGGTVPYVKYEVSTSGAGGPFTTITDTYTATATGTYTFRVTDSATPACTAVSAPVTVTLKATALTINATPTDVKCNGSATGVITITALSGKAPFKYNVTKAGVSVSTSAITTGLQAGLYNVVVTDDLGCTSASTPVTINQLDPLTATTALTTALTCGTANAPQKAVITVSAPSGGSGGYEYSYNNGSYTTDTTFETTLSGTVTIRMRDSNNCTQDLADVVVNTLNPPVITSVTPSIITCKTGEDTSTATIVATGGTGTKVYSIVSGPVKNATGASNGIFTGLTAGTYLFKVTDDNFCSDTFDLTIPGRVNINASWLSQVNVLCYGNPTGSAKITVTNSTSYTAALTSGTGTVLATGSTVDVTGLVAGAYNLRVTDTGTECFKDVPFTITQSADLALLSNTDVNANCNKPTATVTVTATGGKAPYKYAFVANGVTPTAANYLDTNVGNLDPATPDWDVYVLDANNCSKKIYDVTVAKDALPSISAPAAQCFTGPFTITLSGSGGVGTLKYTVNGASISGNTYKINAPGTYILGVIDGNNCPPVTVSYVVDKQLIAGAELRKDITCTAPQDAIIDVTITNGVGPFSYQIYNGGTAFGALKTSSTATFTETFATQGSYTFEIKDSKTCTFTTAPVEVTPTQTLVLNKTLLAKPILCNGQSDAEITVTYNNSQGTGPFDINVKQYADATHLSLTKDFGTQTSGLPAGFYVVTLTDSRGCFKTDEIEIKEPTPISVTYIPTNITCNLGNSGKTKGRIEITQISGGTGPYNVYVTNNSAYYEERLGVDGLSSETFDIIDFGLYQIVVTDANGCPWIEKDILIAQPPGGLGLTVSATPPVCGSLGSAEVKITTAFTGTGPFYFALYTPGIEYAVGDPRWIPEVTPNVSKNAFFNNLIPGVTYTFIVYDKGTNCYYYETFKNTIPSNSTLTATGKAVPIKCKDDDNGSVDLHIENIYSTDVDVSYEIFDSATRVSTGISDNGTVPAKVGSVNGVLDVDDFGFTPGLKYGTYYVLITETSGPNAGCAVTTVPFSITESINELKIIATKTKNDNTCKVAGTITASGIDGTSPYTYAIVDDGDPEPTAFAGVNTFTVDSGDYDVYVKDAYGCIKKADVNVPLDVAPVIDVPAAVCYTGTPIALTITGNTAAIVGPVTYSVDKGAAIGAYKSAANFSLLPGTYTLNLKDGNGCVSSTTYVINDVLTIKNPLNKPLDCYTTGANAEVTVAADGGSGTYAYTIKAGPTTNVTGATSGIFTGLASGDYTFEVNDGNCTETIDVKIAPLNTITPAVAETQPLCIGNNGKVVVSATGGKGNFEYKKGAAGTYSTNDTFTQSAADGTVTYYVRDANHCEVSITATLTDPSPVIITKVDISQLTCGASNSTNEATITVTASGGTGALEYSFDNGGHFSGNNIFKTSIAGPYDIIVRDANKCTSVMQTETIDVLVPPTMVPTKTVIDCQLGNEKSTVNLHRGNGVGPFTYSVVYASNGAVIPSQVDNDIFTSLDAGEYLFRVTDNNGCTDEELVRIPALIPIELHDAIATDVKCVGAATGKAVFTVTGVSAAGYNVTNVSPSVPYTIAGDVITLPNLTARTYTVTIEDNTTKCQSSKSVTINEPLVALAITATASNVSCYKPISTITVTPVGGAGNYEFAFQEGGTVTLPTVFSSNTKVDTALLTNAVTVGAVTTWSVDVYVKDGNNCTEVVNVTITKDVAPTIIAPAPQCYEGTNLIVDLNALTTVHGGPKSYTLNGSDLTTSTATLTGPGKYRLGVRDNNGCEAFVDYIIEKQLRATADLKKDLYCTGTTDASIYVEIKDGVAPYKYQMYLGAAPVGGLTTVPTVPGNSFTVSVATAGDYTFVITDSNAASCSVTTTKVTVNTPTPAVIVSTPVTQSILCNGGTATMKINLSATAGLEPFTYTVTRTLPTPLASKIQTSDNVFTNLPAGTYEITVTDKKGCVSLVTTTDINEPALLTAAADPLPRNTTCSTSTVITVVANGGTKTGSGTGYYYNFNNEGYTTDNTYTVENDGTVQTITYTVKDANGCETGGQTVDVYPLNKPNKLDFSASTITCKAGEDVSTVTVRARNGVGQLTFTIVGTNTTTSNTLFGPKTTPDSSVAASFPGLLPGDYTFQVEDSNGCTFVDLFTVPKLVNLALDAQLVNDISCNPVNGISNNGKATFTVSNVSTSGFTVVGVTPAVPYSVAGNVITLDNISSAGTYTVSIKDLGTDCPKDATVKFTVPAAITFNTVSTKVFCSRDESNITISGVLGGTGIYSYAVVKATTTAPSASSYLDSPTLKVDTNLTDLSWDVYVKDTNGCIAVKTVSVTHDAPPSILPPAPQCYTGTNLVVDLNALTTVYGGAKSYTLNGSDLTTSTATLTGPGKYRLGVRDNNGCEAFVDYIIEKQLRATADLKKDLYCTGTTDASIYVEIKDGVAPYKYQMYLGPTPVGGLTTVPTVPGNSFTVSVATAGDYTFVITDSNPASCSVTTTKVTVNTPTPAVIVSTPVTQSILCNGGTATMKINLSATAGLEPFTYTVTRTLPTPLASKIQTSDNVFTNLPAGTYEITVTDKKGCVSLVTTTDINEPALLTAAADPLPRNTTCSTSTVITVVANGGTKTGSGTGYYYNFNNEGYTTDNTYTVENDGTVQTITYTVKDANGCETGGQTVDVNPLNKPNKLDFSASTITCKAGEDVSSTVTVRATNGVGQLTFTIVGTNTTTSNTLFGPITTPGSASAASFPGLLPGDYTFKVEDSNGCTFVDLFTVPKRINILADGQLVAGVACKGEANGKVTFTVSSIGTSGFTHTISGVTGVGTITPVGTNKFELTNLVTGTYKIDVKDNATDCVSTFSVFVPEPNALRVNYATNKNANCNKGAEITATALDGTPGYTYAFVKAGDPKVYGNSDTAVLDKAFTWVIWAKDSHGCETSIPVTIITDPLPNIVSAIATQCPSSNGTYDITVTATGFDPAKALEYSVDGNSFQNSNVLKVNNTGQHTVTVRDANLCPVSTTVTILEPLKLDYELTTTPICLGNQGVVTLKPSGGTVTPSYEFSKDGVNYGPSPIFTGLVPNTYTFTVKDKGTGCTKSVRVVIETPNQAIDFTLEKTNITCNGYSDGTVTVKMADQTLTVNNNPVYTYSISPAAGTLTGNVFKNLPVGTYTITVTSGKGCPVSRLVAIGDKLPIVVANPTVAEYGCTTGNGTNDATITVSLPSGGSNSYKIYEFIRNGNPVPVQSNDSPVYTETDLLGGSYVINVYDTNGCVGTTTATIKPFVGIEFGMPSAITVTKAITCINDEDIKVNVVMVGTTVPMPVLEYNLKGITAGSTYDVTNNDGIFTGLTIGNYAVTVTNPITGCVLSKIHYVNNPNTFSIVAENLKNVSCFGTPTGSVDLTFVDNQTDPTNDAGPFDYTISGPVNLAGRTTTATINIPNLPEGTYTVKAKLVGLPACEVETSFAIEQPSAALVLTEIHTPISCNPGNDGTISLSAVGGWPGSYKFELSGPISVTYSDQTYFENLTPGTYTVRVKDLNGCVDVKTVQLKNPDPILVTASATVSTLVCNGDTTGQITVDLPTGGQGTNYSYILNYLSTNPVISSAPQPSPVFSNLGAGTYSVTVVDGLNCASQPTADIVIDEPSKVEPLLALNTRLTCKNAATLKLSAVGGTGPYEYSTDANFATVLGSFASSTIITVGLGDHQYYVRDSKGCISTISNNISINPLTPLALETIDVDMVYCKDDPSGRIDASAIGGLGDYIYTLLDDQKNEVRPGQLSGYFELLPAGKYIVRVDSGDCQFDSAVIEITQPTAPLIATANPVAITCNGFNNGKIEITASGGTGKILYAISPNMDQFFEGNTAGGHVFTNLKPGEYDILVMDENSCNVQEKKILITEPDEILVTEIVADQIPEYCFDDKNGMAVVKAEGGTAPYTASIKGNGVTLDYRGPDIDGDKFIFDGLSGAVDYEVMVKDANGCENGATIRLPDPVKLTATAEVFYDCLDDHPVNSLVVEVDNTIDATRKATIVYTLFKDGQATTTVQTGDGTFKNLVTGDYSVQMALEGCTRSTNEVHVDAVEELTAVPVVSKEMNIIEVKASGGVRPYTYSFNNEAFGSSSTYRIYKDGRYDVIVRDNNGCEFKLQVPGDFVDICFANFFTPNGDGDHDTIGPDCGALAYKDLTFDIFDRYGRVVAKYHVGEKWDGKYNGAELPTGDYWYVLKLNDEKDAREFVGHFTLYR